MAEVQSRFGHLPTLLPEFSWLQVAFRADPGGRAKPAYRECFEPLGLYIDEAPPMPSDMARAAGGEDDEGDEPPAGAPDEATAAATTSGQDAFSSRFRLFRVRELAGRSCSASELHH